MKLRNKETGEVVEADYISVARSGFDIKDKDGNIIAKDIRPLPLCYLSVRELTSEFEDYTPKEPLIKDEKIREAMKVWARLNDVKEVMFDKYWHSFRDVDMVISFLFTFKDFDCLENGKSYTIAELCGEGEE